MASQHVGKQTNRQADRADEIGDHLNHNEEWDQHLRSPCWHEEAEEVKVVLEQRDQGDTDKDKGRHKKGDNDLRCESIRIGYQSKHVAKQQEDKQREDEWEIGAAFAANIAADHISNKLIHHFGSALHAAWNKLAPTHGRHEKNAADQDCQQHEKAGIGERYVKAASGKLDKGLDFKLFYG